MVKWFVSAMVAFLLSTAVLHAQKSLPDVSKWSCPAEAAMHFAEYKVDICLRDGVVGRAHYTKVDGELVFVHEHRTVSGQEKFYNALKLDTGEWVENLGDKDYAYQLSADKDNNRIMVLTDDEGKGLGARLVKLVK